MASLYLHLPFCKKICPYCDFTRTVYRKETVDEYLEVLLKSLPEGDFETIYWGGGTPSCLSYQQLDKLLGVLDGRCKGEYTCECNVDDIEADKLELLKSHGLNRLSLGVQSFSDRLLQIAGRSYDGQRAVSALELAQKNFVNYSIDLLYGLPGQSGADFRQDLLKAIGLKIPHLSLYALSIPEKSLWGKQGYTTDDDAQADLYDIAIETLKDYQHYEVSNFALPGYQAQHNLVYWRYQDYYGCGCGASGKLGNYRYTYTGNIQEYLDKQSLVEELRLSKTAAINEYTMLKLRLAEGIDPQEFRARWHYDFWDYYQQALEKHRTELVSGPQNIAIKEAYWFTGNQILVDFIKDDNDSDLAS